MQRIVVLPRLLCLLFRFVHADTNFAVRTRLFQNIQILVLEIFMLLLPRDVLFVALSRLRDKYNQFLTVIGAKFRTHLPQNLLEFILYMCELFRRLFDTGNGLLSALVQLDAFFIGGVSSVCVLPINVTMRKTTASTENTYGIYAVSGPNGTKPNRLTTASTPSAMATAIDHPRM